MAYISSEKLEKSNKNDGFKKQGITNADYSVFTTDEGEKIIQINTYGSDSREKKGRMSQTIQFNEDVLGAFLTDMNLNSVIKNKEAYFMWLKNDRGLEEKTVNTYRSNIKRFGDILGDSNYVYQANSEEEVNNIIEIFSTNKELQEKNKNEHNGYSSALNRYKEFIIAKQKNIDYKNSKNNNFNVKGLKKVNSYEFKKEDLFNIENYINNKGFIYSYEDYCNFYLSIKTKPFVILAGISGTGKSKLVKLFAEAIGATTSNGQYNLISVKPDWNDSTELLGYKNIKDDFIPGKMLEIIKEAIKEENKNKPYFICLDEMNLARVEYYLSEYLSIIESREIKNGEITTDTIFSDNYFPQENEYSGITFPENLYVIGTVNMDDSTFAFSRKVLDRANTIEFSDVNLETLDFPEHASDPVIVDNTFIKTKFLNIKDALEIDREYVKLVNNKVIEINNILKTYSKHFAYRVRDEIVFYMIENKLSALLDEDTAFDYQIMQKILPSIIGSDECIKDILIKLYNYCVDGFELNPEGDYVEEAEKNIDKAKYKLSANKIRIMLRGYRDGYTSFWL